MESNSPSLSEALVVWTGFGTTNSPSRHEQRLIEAYGEDLTVSLLPEVLRLADEFYESDAALHAPDLVSMGEAAKARFNEVHPELTDVEVEALAWCYKFDHK